MYSKLLTEFFAVRKLTCKLAEPLTEAQAQLQSMPDASPAKWHLAHTTWFFETFILCQHDKTYQRLDEKYNYLFNSYYNGIGKQYPRAKRGEMRTPSLAKVIEYRDYVDEHITRLFQTQGNVEIMGLLELGLHHEQQHQELLLMDVKHGLFHESEQPAYIEPNEIELTTEKALAWRRFDEGVYEIGHGDVSFAYDNEKPRHKTYLYSYEIANRPVTNGEYLQFVQDKAYSNAELWLADGWTFIQQNNLNKPFYWQQRDDEWFEYTLYGWQALDLNAAVSHVNFYEANAYACWVGKRLPSEAEWEVATRETEDRFNLHNLLVGNSLHDVWQWTSSNYAAYPGFEPFSGVAGEYNGKFMCNQYVLKGGCCITPPNHIRATYRNFFYPYQSWMVSGIRLAGD